MTTRETPTDVPGGVAFLARSDTRVRILRELSAADRLDRDTLRARLDVARTTLARNLDPLAERGWVAATDTATYVLTLAGETVLAEFERFAETVTVVDEFEPFLRAVPRGAFDLHPRHLAGADLVVATPSDPYAPITRHVEAIETAERYRGLLPAVGLSAMETGTERLADGATAELVVGPGVAETLRSESAYADRLDEVPADAGMRLFVATEPVPFFLGVFDATVQIGVADENGKPQALVETGDETVRAWAEETLADYRADARPLSIE